MRKWPARPARPARVGGKPGRAGLLHCIAPPGCRRRSFAGLSGRSCCPPFPGKACGFLGGMEDSHGFDQPPLHVRRHQGLCPRKTDRRDGIALFVRSIGHRAHRPPCRLPRLLARLLRTDNRAIFRAASAVSLAADYLLAFRPEPELAAAAPDAGPNAGPDAGRVGA